MRLSRKHYQSLAALRYALRKFLRFSEEAATAAGLTPQQHQALLAIKGFPDREYVSIAELAELLQLQHHSVVGLVDRLSTRKLVRRARSREDRRRVEVHLTLAGQKLIEQLSVAHLQELRELAPDLSRLLDSITSG
jgi:DNA-binding MarR family transcriptional regulator